MIWKAILKNGQEIYEYLNGKETKFESLDHSQVKQFALIDSAQEFVKLDLSNGKFELANLDLNKLETLTGGELINFVFDADSQCFKIGPKSLQFINDLLLPQHKSNSISFDNNGQFAIAGVPFSLGFKQGEQEEKFTTSPIEKIVHIKDAVTDFIGGARDVNPYKRLDVVTSYTIGYDKKHKFNTCTFNLSLILKYDIMQKCVRMDCLISTDEDINGELCVYYDTNVSSLSVSLGKNESARLERVITLM